MQPNISKTFKSQHRINIRFINNIFTFLYAKATQSCVNFLLTAHLSSDQLHCKCSVATSHLLEAIFRRTE